MDEPKLSPFALTPARIMLLGLVRPTAGRIMKTTKVIRNARTTRV